MKGFDDIIFEPHPVGEGFHGKIFVPNGYGVSVVRFKTPHNVLYGSYTSNDNEWEVAILKGNENEWEICYDTEITDDVIGHQTEGEVTWIMVKVQQL
jgi:hypothetical protein